MKRKHIIISVLVAFLFALLVQSHFDYQCKVNGAGWANVTMHGVLCGYTLNGFDKHIRLDDLLLRDEKNRKYEECAKRNVGAEYKCSPQYIPPPTDSVDA